MYDLLAIFLVSYIKSFKNIEVFDAKYHFESSANYASFYIINLAPVSPHPMLVDKSQFDDANNTKTFTYKENSDISIRIEFRGDESYTNIELFKHSFLLEDNKKLLKDSGFGYFGMSPIEPIVTLRDAKSKHGFFTTIKLKSSILVDDVSKIIGTVDIAVSNQQ